MKFASFDIVFQEIPNEVTLALNITGCPNRCPGCHSPHLIEDRGEELSYEALDMLMEQYRSSITCVCFMGGDHDRGYIESMGRYLHDRWGVKSGWYSGREVMPDDIGSLDYVKLGDYREALGGLNSPTTNQRLYHLVDGAYEDVTSQFWK